MRILALDGLALYKDEDGQRIICLVIIRQNLKLQRHKHKLGNKEERRTQRGKPRGKGQGAERYLLISTGKNLPTKKA